MTETYCIPEKDTENVPDNFDFYQPSASHLLECILHTAKYEISAPLKGCRYNRLYTVKGFTVNDINCDDNGAYHQSNTSNHVYAKILDENNKVSIREVKKNQEGKWVYKT